MALTEKAKKGLKWFSIIGGIAIVAMLIYAFSDKLSMLGKNAGDVQTLEQSDASVDEAIDADVLETATTNLPFHPLPKELRLTKGMELNGEGIMWNGSAAFLAASGGDITKQGSYFAELGKEYKKPFMLKLKRQDDYMAQQDNLVNFTKAYVESKGKTTNVGSAFVWFMGDNSEVYINQANKKLNAISKDLGLKEGELYAEGFVIPGYSDGEDKAMGLADWAEDPTKALGEVFACFPQDGDQNLVIKWATDNGLPINPDGSTYCREAVNFYFTDGFMQAAEAWGTMTGERMVVTLVKDEKTGEMKTRKTGDYESVQINGTATWTPGDELAFRKAKQLGVDLVSLYSTHDNRHQMPCIIVSVNKFIDENPEVIDAITEGTLRMGDQMKVHPKAFNFAMQCMADVYKQKDADYWGRYFKGVREETPNGHEIILGGTRVCNLADNLDAFGIGEGSRGTFQSSYELFGGFMHKLYPEVLEERLPFYKAMTTEPLNRVMSKLARANEEMTEPDMPVFEEGEITRKVAERSYSIEFELGKASLTKAGIAVMEEMFNDLNTHDLKIKIAGHTDNQGSDAINLPLSEARAQTVAKWLKAKSVASFPNNRFAEIKGYGSSAPLADNSTKSGQQKNRRVEITVGD